MPNLSSVGHVHLTNCIMNYLLLLFSVLLVNQSVAQSFSFIDLKTEYLINPIGLDIPRPRLNFRANDSDIKQKIFIQISKDSLFNETGNLVWKSNGFSSDINQIVYSGAQLEAFQKYFWRIVEDQKPISAVASFEMGKMSPKDWKGSWISDGHDRNKLAAPYFRKQILLKKKIKSARAYIATGGLYELSINGEKVGNHRLDPAFTRYDRRLLYVSYDVTKALAKDQNLIGVVLGNGWYNHQSMAVWYFDEAPWRNRPTFCLDIHINYVDGTSEVIATDKSWKTSEGPLQFNSIYTAEHYDARLEKSTWLTKEEIEKDWKPVVVRAAPAQHIVAQSLHPIRNTQRIPPLKMTQMNDTTYVFDFGRNIAGVTELSIMGPSGTRIRLKHGERLDAKGYVDISNIDEHYRPKDARDPFQTDIILLSGRQDKFMPKFNYKGFQYVELTSSIPLAIKQDNLTAFFMHSDVPVVGTINSSNEVLNKIWSATNNSYLSNLFGYPTDCPQREKNGWTGDGHIAVETGLYNFDAITIYEKWLADHFDEQQANGIFPAIIPSSGWGYDWANGPDWTSSIAIIPWNIYLFYGDSRLLQQAYEPLKRYVNYIDEQSPEGLTSWGLGDWVPVNSSSSVELTTSIYFYTNANILTKAAQLFNMPEDVKKYQQLARKIKNAINAKYLNLATGQYASGLQTEQSMPLYWGIVPEEVKAKVVAKLVQRVNADGNKIDVGLLGTKSLLNALSENGHADLAYTLASREEYPSWGWWIKNGATTLYENWNINAKRDISMNHIMFGEIGAWLYKGIAGIKPDEGNPGFKHILLKPHIMPKLKDFKASYSSIRGEIAIEWKTVNKKIILTVTIPPATTATLMLPTIPNKKVYQQHTLIKTSEAKILQSGVYSYVYQ